MFQNSNEKYPFHTKSQEKGGETCRKQIANGT